MRTQLIITCTFLCTLFTLNTFSQTNSADVNDINKTRLFNGTEYAKHPANIQGHAYLNEQYSLGTLRYQNINYIAVPLKYDLVKDELITLYLDGSSELKFIPEFVSNFSIDGHNFFYFSTDSLKGTSLSTGYYEAILTGQIGFYAKRRKIIKENISTQTIISKFLEEDRFFVKMNGSFYSVSGRRSLLKLFKDQRKELINFIQRSNLNFRDEPEQAMKEVITQYNRLKN